MADDTPVDPANLVLALATLPEAQRIELARTYITAASTVMDAGDLRLGRAYSELARVVAHATDLVDDVTLMADRLMSAALTPPVMISPN